MVTFFKESKGNHPEFQVIGIIILMLILQVVCNKYQVNVLSSKTGAKNVRLL